MLNSAQQCVEDLSIITAVYNHQETSHRFHVYCLNDASTDDSGAILSDYQARHPDKITVFTSAQNQGTGKKSILHHRPPVRGQYWTLLAGDDYWTAPDKIEKQISILNQNPKAQGCSSHTVMRNEQTREETIIKPDKQHWNLMDMVTSRYGLYVHPSSIIWRNSFLENGNFFPPPFIRTKMTGDTLLLHMSLAQGGEIVNYPEITSCYRVTGHGVWSKLSKAEQEKMNKNIRKFIISSLPLKYRLARWLIKTEKFPQIAELFPKPVNR